MSDFLIKNYNNANLINNVCYLIGSQCFKLKQKVIKLVNKERSIDVLFWG